ncbi:hypothetical protein JW916_14790 [Candidatus Sumerlaeota bacterium]|nr:hypothetical protein [Candidatus Sumerlaeota bacterium]
MVQAHSRPVLAEPGLLQIVCLFDPLDTPFAVVDASGHLLYGNPSFGSLMSRVGRGDSLLLLRDVIHPSGRMRSPFLESGALDSEALPYCGHCRLESPYGSGASMSAMVRLELFQSAPGAPWVALCTLASVGSDSPETDSAVALRRIRQWLGTIAEASETPDVAFLACQAVKELTGAGAVVFYQAERGAWIRMREAGIPTGSEAPPERVGGDEPWVREMARLDSAADFASFWQYLEAKSLASPPPWIAADAEGVLIPCKRAGRVLGFMCAWRETQWLEPEGLRDQMELVAIQTASALERIHLTRNR